MNGPSLALLSISTSFGFAIPTWVTCATPLLLPMAAWAYYRLSGPLEDDSVGISKEHEQTTDWIWAGGWETMERPRPYGQNVSS